MAIRVGINGFGRIGRLVYRAGYQRPGVEFVVVNDLPVGADVMAHLLKYDSNFGPLPATVTGQGDTVAVNGKPFKVVSFKNPAEIPWKDFGVQIVVESTGIFTDAEKAKGHLHDGVKKVIISAPAKNEDVTIVLGVNDAMYDPAKHQIISNASCTTNCLAPMVKVLKEAFGVTKGLMTTIHSYTNDQKILDAPHKDLRRARSAATNQIPTTTGAAQAVGLVLPELKGKLDGMSIRVPTSNVSCIDFVCIVKKETDATAVNQALQKSAERELKNILGVETAPLVSSDFLGDTHSSIVDGPSTKAIGNLVKVLAWYDNEVGFSSRLLDLTKYIGERL